MTPPPEAPNSPQAGSTFLSRHFHLPVRNLGFHRLAVRPSRTGWPERGSAPETPDAPAPAAAPAPETAPAAPPASGAAAGAALAGGERPAKRPSPQPAAKLPPRPERAPVPQPVPPPRLSSRKTPRRAPLAVNAGALLIFAAGVVVLVAGFRAAMDPGRGVPEATAQLLELGVPADTLLVLARVADVAMTAVTFGACFFLASVIRDGRNWARVCCAALVAAALFFGVLNHAEQHVAAALIAGTGLALSFLPGTARYFARGRARTLGS